MSISEGADVTAIDAMYASALRSFQAGDLEAVLAHWEESGAYIWPAVPPSIGKGAIRAAYAEFFSTWTAQEIYQPHEITVSESLAYRRFSTILTLTAKSNGKTTVMKLNGIHVYGRQPDGQWKFKVVIATNAP